METADGIKHQDNYKKQPKRCKGNTTLKVGQDVVYMYDRNIVYHQCYLQGIPISKARITFSKQNFSK